ncbi:unnamed protein product [Parnassius apollo]|uniref:(apollo) hypothetical protein n=1 Tax=Parnassius apollo TaxID=110799 RepID=A0A8S3WYY2_PARAO|nr:unnamed protein product [Parnassius apollo]
MCESLDVSTSSYTSTAIKTPTIASYEYNTTALTSTHTSTSTPITTSIYLSPIPPTTLPYGPTPIASFKSASYSTSVGPTTLPTGNIISTLTIYVPTHIASFNSDHEFASYSTSIRPTSSPTENITLTLTTHVPTPITSSNYDGQSASALSYYSDIDSVTDDTLDTQNIFFK